MGMDGVGMSGFRPIVVTMVCEQMLACAALVEADDVLLIRDALVCSSFRCRFVFHLATL